jgi:hypothetical protein
MLSSLAGSVLLAQPALAEEDAVDSAVANLTEAVKVGCSCMGTFSQQDSSSKYLYVDPQLYPAPAAAPPVQLGNKLLQAASEPAGDATLAVAPGSAHDLVASFPSSVYQNQTRPTNFCYCCFLQAAGQGVKAAIDLVGAGVKIAQEGYEVAAPVIKQGVDAVAPVVSEAVKVTTETAAPLLSKATPVVKVRTPPVAYIRYKNRSRCQQLQHTTTWQQQGCLPILGRNRRAATSRAGHH